MPKFLGVERAPSAFYTFYLGYSNPSSQEGILSGQSPSTAAFCTACERLNASYGIIAYRYAQGGNRNLLVQQ